VSAGILLPPHMRRHVYISCIHISRPHVYTSCIRMSHRYVGLRHTSTALAGIHLGLQATYLCLKAGRACGEGRCQRGAVCVCVCVWERLGSVACVGAARTSDELMLTFSHELTFIFHPHFHVAPLQRPSSRKVEVAGVEEIVGGGGSRRKRVGAPHLGAPHLPPHSRSSSSRRKSRSCSSTSLLARRLGGGRSNTRPELPAAEATVSVTSVTTTRVAQPSNGDECTPRCI
jgi:hypothetical protein